MTPPAGPIPCLGEPAGGARALLWRTIRAATLEKSVYAPSAPVYVAVGTRHPDSDNGRALVSLFPASLDVYRGADHFEIHTQYAGWPLHSARCGRRKKFYREQTECMSQEQITLEGDLC